MRPPRIVSGAICAIVLVALAAPASAHAANVSPRLAGAVIELATTPLQRGLSAQISAKAVGVTQCSLAFSGPAGLRSGPFGVAVHVQGIQWSWLVPKDARAGIWTAIVACAGAQPTIETLSLKASSRGSAPIVSPGSLRTAPITGDDYDGGKGGGNDCAPGKLDPTSGYCTGYCTEFVWSRRPDLPHLGDASQWWGRTTEQTGREPAVGAVAWWGARAPGRPYGHVAIVVAVGAGGVTVREMNHGVNHWGVTDVRTIGLRDQDAPEGYIYAGAPPARPRPPTRATPGGVTDSPPDEVAGAAQIATYSDTSRFAPGPPIAAGQAVYVDCFEAGLLEADPGNPDARWYRLQSPPWNGSYYATSTGFLNGAAGSATTRPAVDPLQVPCYQEPAGTVPVLVEAAAGPFGASTYQDFLTEKGRGPAVAPYDVLGIVCKQFGTSDLTSRTNPEGWWYQIFDPRWRGRQPYYVSAAAFLNGDPVGGPFVRHVDQTVPDC